MILTISNRDWAWDGEMALKLGWHGRQGFKPSAGGRDRQRARGRRPPAAPLLSNQSLMGLGSGTARRLRSWKGVGGKAINPKREGNRNASPPMPPLLRRLLAVQILFPLAHVEIRAGRSESRQDKRSDFVVLSSLPVESQMPFTRRGFPLLDSESSRSPRHRYWRARTAHGTFPKTSVCTLPWLRSRYCLRPWTPKPWSWSCGTNPRTGTGGTTAPLVSCWRHRVELGLREEVCQHGVHGATEVGLPC